MGSCGSESEKRVRDGGRLWWKGKITSPIPEKKGGESEKKELGREVDTFPKKKKKKNASKRWHCYRPVRPSLTLLRNPLRTLAALTDNERGILICFSNITAGGDRKGVKGWTRRGEDEMVPTLLLL